MRILNLTVNDFGGAGTAAVRINNALKEFGHDSSLHVINSKREDSVVVKLSWLRAIYRRFDGHIRFVENLLRFFRYQYFFFDRRRRYLNASEFRNLLDNFDPEVIVLHWTSGFFSIRELAEWLSNKSIPVYWVVMDMYPLTAGCHFTRGCEGYLEGCRSCPATVTNVARKNNQELQELLKYSNLTYVAPSKTLLAECRQLKVRSLLCHFPSHKIALEKRCPSPSIVVGVGDRDNLRKGGSYIDELICQLEERFSNLDILFIASKDRYEYSKANRYRFIPYLDEDDYLYFLAQADVFVSLSVEDAGPMAINDALLNKTFTIAFDVGVARDFAEYKSVRIINIGDLEGVVDAIQEFIETSSKDFDVPENLFNLSAFETELTQL